MKIKNMLTKRVKVLVTVLASLGLSVSCVSSAFASTMTYVNVMETNMNASGTSSFAIDFKPSAADAASTVTIDFGSWGGTVNSSQTVSTASCSTYYPGSTALPSTSTLSAAGSGNIVTISNVNTLSASNNYCAILTGASAVTNPGTGVYPVTIADGTDNGTAAIDIVTNDQVVVSATVPPSFTLALDTNSDSFTSNLSSGATRSTTGVTATVNTNAASGWYLWGSDSQTGLHSANASHTIASSSVGSNTSLSNGTEGYISGINAGDITQGSGSAGTTAATTAYASSGAGNGAGLNGTPHQLATSNGTANGASVKVKEFATISGVTPAATDYTDTITLVGAGSF